MFEHHNYFSNHSDERKIFDKTKNWDYLNLSFKNAQRMLYLLLYALLCLFMAPGVNCKGNVFHIRTEIAFLNPTRNFFFVAPEKLPGWWIQYLPQYRASLIVLVYSRHLNCGKFIKVILTKVQILCEKITDRFLNVLHNRFR